MTDQITLRACTSADTPAVDALLAKSYPVLLKPDYAPSILVMALPLIARARPELMRCGTYYVAEDGEGKVLAAGGWTFAAPQGGVGPRHVGHVRHLVTDPAHTRKGLATALMRHVLAEALRAGIRVMNCQSTRTATPFYASMGFRKLGEIEISLRPGITFPAVEMTRNL